MKEEGDIRETINHFFVTAFIVIIGDIFGLTIYYLSHLQQFTRLGRCQCVLLIMISLLIGGAEAIKHSDPENDKRKRLIAYAQLFFFTVLIAMALTFKPF